MNKERLALGGGTPCYSDLGFETPSEVQEKTIPLLLEDDIDLVALAQTCTKKSSTNRCFLSLLNRN